MARKKGQLSRFLAGGLLLLLIVGLSGLGARNFGGQIRSIGKVGDTEIGIDDYSRALNEELRALQAQTGQPMTLSQARQFGVDQAVLQRLISTAALENEAATVGISLGDAQIQQQVLANAAFRGSSGAFDRDSYEFTLQQSGLTPGEYEERLRTEAASTIIQSAVISGIAVPPTYARVMLDYIGQRRSFSYVSFDETTLDEPIPAPTDTQLQEYFTAHPDEFMLPPMRRITYAWLSPEMVLDQVQVDEDSIRALYEERSDQYNTPEKRLVERLVFATEEDAKAAADALARGEKTFEDLVAERGLSLDDVDMGDVSADDLGDAADAVFGLDGPGIAGPVDTELGPALFRVNAVLDARSTPYEEVRDALRDEIAADRARRLVADMTSELDDLLAGGATLEELGAETQMKLGKLDWVDGQTEGGIAAYDDFAKAARTVSPDDYPQLTELNDGGVFALRLDEEVPERPDTFENARDRVAKAWRRNELEKRLQAQADQALAQLAVGNTLSSLGYPVSVRTRLTRTAFIEGAPAELMTEVFQMKPGDVITVKGDGKVLVVQLNEILPPDPQDPDLAAIETAITDDMKQGLGQDALAAFVRASELSAGITLNQAAINAVHAQFP